MYLTVVNDNNSRIEIEEEAKLIWTSLLLADKVVAAGLSTAVFDWKDQMAAAPYSEGIFKLMEKMVPKLYNNQDDAMTAFKFYRKTYLELNSIKHKNHNQTLVYMRMLRGLNNFRKEMVRWSQSYAEMVKVKEILPYAAKENNTIELFYIPDEKTERVKKIASLISIDEYILIVNKNSINDIPSVNIEEAVSDDIQKDKLSYIYSEIADLPFLIEIPYEHFNIVRENFLAGSKVFRGVLAELKDIAAKAEYNCENLSGFKKTFDILKEHAAVYKKIESENLLLNQLNVSGGINHRVKISAALTSYGNFISLLEKQNILESRESLYVRAEVIRYKFLEGICPFLIAEELP